MNGFSGDERINTKTKKKVQLAAGYESDSDVDGAAGSDGSDASDESEDDDSSSEKVDEKTEIQTENLKENERDEDDDMFASETEEIAPKPAPVPIKKKTFDLDDFEKEHGLDDYTFSENSIIREESKPSVQLEAFNLREEVESGKFDKDMNYIRQDGKDSDDEDEPWAVETSIDEISKARKAEEALSSKLAQNPAPSQPTSSVLSGLISLLEPAETPMEALARLRPAKRKRVKNVKTTEKGENGASAQNDSVRKDLVFQITENCEQLVNKGVSAVYDMSREELMRVYRQETGEDFPRNTKKRSADEMTSTDTPQNEYGEPVWQYRWSGESEVNGPYSAYEMQYWKDTYFENKVEVKRVTDDTFTHISKTTFSE